MSVAAIVIGRNEGARLIRCLESLQGVSPLIYVDSGSTDDSVPEAERLGAEVVALDLSQPFTAARARNAGLDRLGDRAEFVQFVDGDCEIRDGWIATARAHFETHPQTVVVCGRRRERFPEASVYNWLTDQEWDTPLGQVRACGGDALMRVAALRNVGGYNPDLIAGEEPELCVRLRQAGGEVWRIDAEMTWHDAAMTRLSQWWKRSRRAGHAYAEGAHLHGAAPEFHNVQQTRRALIWGLLIPLLAVLGLFVSAWAITLLLLWPLQVLRLAACGMDRRQAFFLTLGKLPEALGVIEFHIRRLRGTRRGILEYK